MRWLYATIGLVAMCACLIAWIYLRDRDTNWQPPEHALTCTKAVGSYPCRPAIPRLTDKERHLSRGAPGAHTAQGLGQ